MATNERDILSLMAQQDATGTKFVPPDEDKEILTWWQMVRQALEPETAGGTAGLVGASMIPGVGEAIDAADLAAAFQDRDPVRAGFALAGLLVPVVGGSTLRQLATKGSKALKEGLMEAVGRLSKKMVGVPDEAWKEAVDIVAQGVEEAQTRHSRLLDDFISNPDALEVPPDLGVDDYVRAIMNDPRAAEFLQTKGRIYDRVTPTSMLHTAVKDAGITKEPWMFFNEYTKHPMLGPDTRNMGGWALSHGDELETVQRKEAAVNLLTELSRISPQNLTTEAFEADLMERVIATEDAIKKAIQERKSLLGEVARGTSQQDIILEEIAGLNDQLETARAARFRIGDHSQAILNQNLLTTRQRR